MSVVDLRIDIPSTHRYPDAFYLALGVLWIYQSALSTRPGHDIAKANNVPVTTVHGWIKEGRRRGLITGSNRAPGYVPEHMAAVAGILGVDPVELRVAIDAVGCELRRQSRRRA